jgi:hypothetical protein
MSGTKKMRMKKRSKRIKCGKNGQGRSLITFIQFEQFKCQINTNSTQRETPLFIPNKWADPFLRRGADPIQVKKRISNNFM